MRFAHPSGAAVSVGFFKEKTSPSTRTLPAMHAGALLSSSFFGKKTEEVGFEPTDPCGPPVFKTGAIGHSATLPYKGFQILAIQSVLIKETVLKTADRSP